jgi:hypothetical protein
MAVTTDVIRRITIQGRADGLDRIQKSLADVDRSMKAVAGSAEVVVTATEEQSRSVLSAASAFDRMLRSVDPAHRAQRLLETSTRAADRALAQGAISAEQHARALASIQQRFGGVATGTALMASGISNATHAAGQLSFQLNDIATGLVTGQSPFMIAAQQAGQISQILGANGGGLRAAAGTIGAAFMSMLNPVNLVIVGLGAAASAAAYFFSSSEDGAAAAEEALKRHEGLIREITDRYGEAAEAAFKLVREAGAGDLAYRASEGARDTQRRFDAELTAARDQLRLATDPDALMAFPEARPFQAAIDSFQQGLTTVDQFRESVKNISMAPSATDEIRDYAAQLIAATDAAAELALQLKEAETAVGVIAATPQMREPYNPARNPAMFAFPGGAPVPTARPSELTVDPYEVLDAPRPKEGGNPLYDLTAEPDPVAKPARDPFAEAMDAAGQRVDQLRQEQIALGLSGEALARYNAEMQFMNQLRRDWNELSPEQQSALQAEATRIGDVAAEVERARAAHEDLIDAQKRSEEASKALMGSIEDVFMGIIEGGDSARQAILKLAQEMLRAALIGEGPFAGFFAKGGLLGGGGSGGGASGGAGVASTAASVIAGAPASVGAAANSNVAPAVANAFSAIGSGSGPGGAAALVDATGAEAQAWNFWASKGLAPHQVAGIMGNIHAESSFNPNAIGDGGRAHGLYQHHPDRRAGIEGFLGDPMKQHELAWRELQGPESGAWNRLMAATDVRSATAAFTGFERPQGWSLNAPENAHGWTTRLAGAEQALAKFGQTTSTATEGLGSFGTGLAGFGDALAGGGAGGGGGGMFGGILSGILGLLGGGFAKGGISDRPAIFGEAGPEAAVPLPDGRRIPVQLSGRTGGNVTFGGTVVNIHGNADGQTMEQMSRMLERHQKRQAREMTSRDNDRWRTAA